MYFMSVYYLQDGTWLGREKVDERATGKREKESLDAHE